MMTRAQELAMEIKEAETLREAYNQIEEFCDIAGMINEWYDARLNAEQESVVCRAANYLDIDLKGMPLERFATRLGYNADHGYISELSDEELAAEIRDDWDLDFLRDLCYRADMLYEWVCADDCGSNSFEHVAFKAAEKLGVEIL